jgi:hypothetical protein
LLLWRGRLLLYPKGTRSGLIQPACQKNYPVFLTTQNCLGAGQSASFQHLESVVLFCIECPHWFVTFSEVVLDRLGRELRRVPGLSEGRTRAEACGQMPVPCVSPSWSQAENFALGLLWSCPGLTRHPIQLWVREISASDCFQPWRS